MPKDFQVVDLFSGPGGLGEGFSAYRDRKGKNPFRIALSVEKEDSAYETLLLRSFLRKFKVFPAEYYEFLNGGGTEPDWKTLYPAEWTAAKNETLKLELGSSGAKSILKLRLKSLRKRNTILIGGPPCQAYSLVGRARNRGIVGYIARKDARHFLYQEYIEILKTLKPAAFVMENVKGMLSAAVDGSNIFEIVLRDLRNAGSSNAYRLVALAVEPEAAIVPEARDFVVRSESFGVPQARHRVIVVGIRSDIATHAAISKLLQPRSTRTTVRMLLGNMPRLRSGVSRGEDSFDIWKQILSHAIHKVEHANLGRFSQSKEAFQAAVKRCKRSIKSRSFILARGDVGGQGPPTPDCPKDLNSWIVDSRIKSLPNHETRGHMKSDLARYFFASIYGEVFGVSPKAREFPVAIAPAHVNWKSGKFEDRFRVQTWDNPSTTITSHISKDGHYFIHPDPLQCRSLTVREAARLQTFPDNYFFKGNRTQQYVQVGNAVPPFLALQIARSLHSILTPSERRGRELPMQSMDLDRTDCSP